MINNKKSNVERIFALTPLQEGMLYHYVGETSKSAYFEQSTITVNNKLDIDICKKTFEVLSKKHDILRCAVVYRKVSIPRQLILANRVIETNVLDYSSMSEDERLKAIEKAKKDDINRGFDLELDPLMRVTIIKNSEEFYNMIWSFHHIIMDGWCISIILKDFIEIYEKISTKRSSKEYLIKQYSVKSSIKYEEYVR